MERGRKRIWSEGGSEATRRRRTVKERETLPPLPLFVPLTFVGLAAGGGLDILRGQWSHTLRGGEGEEKEGGLEADEEEERCCRAPKKGHFSPPHMRWSDLVPFPPLFPVSSGFDRGMSEKPNETPELYYW